MLPLLTSKAANYPMNIPMLLLTFNSISLSPSSPSPLLPSLPSLPPLSFHRRRFVVHSWRRVFSEQISFFIR